MASKSLPVIVSPEVYSQFNACVHCGLCLPACPTYVETGDEADSPRGRIHLMKAVVDGRIEVGPGSESVFEHLDRCLICRACETACPSGVVYHEVIEAVRPQVAEAVLGEGKRSRSGVLQWMVGNVLPYSGRAAAAMGPLALARKVGLGGMAEKIARMMPGPLGAMADLAPAGASAEELPAVTAAVGKHRGNVVLLRGCVGSVVSGAINAACAKVISENGFDVHVLANEPCCGAMAAHGNNPGQAAVFGQAMVEMLAAKGGDYFVSPIAGCGAQLKGMGGSVKVGKSKSVKEVVGRVRDVTEFLVEIGVRVPTGRVERTVTYHDPCHLVHGQRVSEQPRYLLGLVPGLKVVELAESDMCCGAAGTYSLSQPAMAERLGERKVAAIVETGAEELVTANVGCALQIARALKRRGGAGREMRVRHVVEVLAESYGRE